MNNENTPFLSLILRGRRFDRHSIPVDVLEEFSRYQSLIIDIARALYYQRHPQRKRVPQGFIDQFKLRLKDIEPGSAAPILYRVPPEQNDAQSELPLESDIFADAQAQLAEYIDAISRGEPAPVEFPAKVLRRFRSFGKAMRPDESMEFVLPGQETGPRYDVETRQKIVRLQGDNYEETVEKVGNMRSVDTPRRTFRLETKTNEMIEGEYPAEYESELLLAHKAYRAFAVRIEATGIYSPNGELKKVTDITDLSLQDDGPDLENRFDELAALQNGWFDGSGYGIDPELLQKTRELIGEVVYEHNCFVPRVYPTPEGGIQIEWKLADWDVEIEFERDQLLSILAEQRSEEIWEEWEASINSSNLAERIANFVNRCADAQENLEVNS